MQLSSVRQLALFPFCPSLSSHTISACPWQRIEFTIMALSSPRSLAHQAASRSKQQALLLSSLDKQGTRRWTVGAPES